MPKTMARIYGPLTIFGFAAALLSSVATAWKDLLPSGCS